VLPWGKCDHDQPGRGFYSVSFHLPPGFAAGLQFLSGRSDSYQGVRTFLQRHWDFDAINYELNSAAELMDGGAHVAQLLDCIDPGWHGSPEHIPDFAIRVYDLLLTSVISLARGRGTGCGRWAQTSPVREIGLSATSIPA